MAFCSKCGAELPADVMFCPGCGVKREDAVNTAPVMDPEDVEKNKALAVLCYVGGFLFVPLIAAKDSPFVRFHLNNGLWLLISYVLCAIVPYVGWVACVVLFVFNIIGLVRCAKGRCVGLPILGNFTKFFK